MVTSASGNHHKVRSMQTNHNGIGSNERGKVTPNGNGHDADHRGKVESAGNAPSAAPSSSSNESMEVAPSPAPPPPPSHVMLQRGHGQIVNVQSIPNGHDAVINMNINVAADERRSGMERRHQSPSNSK